ncbi:MAG: heme-binding protein [Pseudomonadota bacterium]
MRQTLTLLLLLAIPSSGLGIESPDYRVLDAGESYEIRLYGGYITADVHIDSSFERAGNQAFRPLFRFISGSNAANQKISMTAPVEQQATGQGYRVSFVMPSDLDFESLPEPEDDRIQFKQHQNVLVAALRYKGSWSKSRFERYETELRTALASTSYQACGSAIVARYNAPFTPGFLRRNEVLLKVSKGGCDADLTALENSR